MTAPQDTAALSIDNLELDAGDFSLRIGGFSLLPGQRVGVIGRNGCGKTTLLEALLGLRRCTRADGTLFGAPLTRFARSVATRARCGVVLQSSEMSLYSTVREICTVHREMYGADWSWLRARLELDELADRRARLLSRGQRQRLMLYLALAHRPELVLLDEPLTGLDRRFSAFLARELFVAAPELARSAFLIVGHAADEAAMCTEFLWLDQGRIVDRGTEKDLLKRHVGSHRVHVRAARAAELDRLESVLGGDLAAARVIRHDPLSLSAFAWHALDAQCARCVPAGGWVSFESGRTGLDELVRVGPRPPGSVLERGALRALPAAKELTCA
jgi:ABC-2 type transport system ATP-binding protein